MHARFSIRLLVGTGILAVVLLLALSMSALSSSPPSVQPQPTIEAGALNLIWLPSSGIGIVKAPRSDLGDAPDSTNSFGTAMTAYPKGGPPGTLARYPTVFTAGSPPYGPLHRSPTARFWLGPAVSLEREADVGADADGVNNLQPPGDRPDLDGADDGTAANPPLPNCQSTKITYTVTVPPGAPASKAYVNLWFDWNRNGAWGDILQCPGVLAKEWAVQNQVISVGGPGSYTFTTPAFLPYNPNPGQCLWWRITLSDTAAANTSNDGSGSANGYLYGETEDYYACGEPQQPQPDLGDAPDSSNHFGLPMTAYPAGGPPGTVARYPTVYGVGSPPYGPLHLNNPLQYFLGAAITRERDADSGPDADPSNNILPLFDAPDKDLADDGAILPPLQHCVPTLVNFTVTVPAGGPASSPYVNLWFDWDRSGAWGGIKDCPNGGVSDEWAVQNQQINLPGPGVYNIPSLQFLPWNPKECVWWRITLSDSKAVSADGSGPLGGYNKGETEDYYWCPAAEPTPTATPTEVVRPTDTPTPTPVPTETPTATPTAFVTETPTPTPTKPVELGESDLGDAPDSTNHFGSVMTAYPIGGPPGIPARYPTVYNGPVPIGPLHRNPKLIYFLGPGISTEKEADMGPDADGINNIQPQPDKPDLDRFDDSANLPPLQHCVPTLVNFTVTVPAGGPASKPYVNLWFDWDRSGDWGQVYDCPNGLAANEWAVQNQQINLPGPGVYNIPSLQFLPWNPKECVWWRISLSDSPAPANDGSGPASGYDYGETEDYYTCPVVEPTVTPTPTFTLQPTSTPTYTPVPTDTPTPIPTDTPTPAPTDTPTATPTKEIPIEGTPDLGDAPDSSNSFIGANMTAYPAGGPPGVLAKFPTVYNVGSPPFGPLHRNLRLAYFLGPSITAEQEADIGPDADGVNNLQPVNDVPNLDKGDDGVAPQPFVHCVPMKLNFTVTVPAGGPLNNNAFVNLWFDWNRSGDWGQNFECPSPTGVLVAKEWAVQNQVVNLPGPGVWPFQTTAFVPYNLNANNPCLWWRITLSDSQAVAADGSGPAAGYNLGETEDYYTCESAEPTETPTPTATPTLPATETPTPTPTREERPTFTPTPTATPTKPPVITGVSSTFTHIPGTGLTNIMLHVVKDDLANKIYDFEIYFDQQQPPWNGATPQQLPPGWVAVPIVDDTGKIIGIRWVTEQSPLPFCQPQYFPVAIDPPQWPGDSIIIYLTDANHQVIGYIVSQPAPAAVQGPKLLRRPQFLPAAPALACG